QTSELFRSRATVRITVSDSTQILFRNRRVWSVARHHYRVQYGVPEATSACLTQHFQQRTGGSCVRVIERIRRRKDGPAQDCACRNELGRYRDGRQQTQNGDRRTWTSVFGAGFAGQ